MISGDSRQQDFSAGNYFSFSSPVSEHEYGAWAENLKTLDNSFVKRDPRRKFGPWVRGVRRTDSSVADESDSSATSPPLWKSVSPEPRGSTSRAQMIAMCRQEMMDLVRDMPETAYELSLRDIVESPASQRMEKVAEVQEEEASLTESLVRKGKGKGKRRGTRTGVMDSAGFLLKFFIPSASSAIDYRNRESSIARSKFSPRPIAAVAADGESSSSCSSNGRKNGGWSSGAGRKWKFGACYPFL